MNNAGRTMEETKPNVSKPRIRRTNRCPNYDDDCDTMTSAHAGWCFDGCIKMTPDGLVNLGAARGYCPIIHRAN